MIRSALIFLALMALPVSAQDTYGRYVAVPTGSRVGVWIIDIQTGEAKFCYVTGTSGSYTTQCTKPTK
jgi:hypothetical protein